MEHSVSSILKWMNSVPVTVLVMTIFFFSLTTLLISGGTQFPERSIYPLPEDSHDQTFWNVTEAISTPITVDTISTSVQIIDSVRLDEWYFRYDSESLPYDNISINSVIIKRQNTTGRNPALLFLHGYGSEYLPYLDVMRDLAMDGFIVMGIDHPGQGDSTGLPPLSPETFLNVSDGPQSANLYHSVIAAVRAITLLESLPYVNASATVISGVSMGAWTSLITSAIDSRVDGVVSMIMAGNLMNSILSGSWLNTVIVPSYSANSEEMQHIIDWFDPLPYIREITQPILMCFGSNDDYYPITSVQDTTNAVNAPLTLNIVPNYGHGVDLRWFDLMSEWMDSQFVDGNQLPSIQVSTDAHIAIQGQVVTVSVNTTDVERAWVCWRSSEPGAVWYRTLMTRISDGEVATFSAEIMPLVIGKLTFYVVVENDDAMTFSSPVYTNTAGSIVFVVLLLMSGLILFNLFQKGEWKLRPHYVIREIPYFIGIATLIIGFSIPFAIIRGRATVSVLEIVELFGNSLFLKSWFMPTFIASISLVLALSTFRHRFPFRVAGMLWTGILIVLIILFIALSTVFGFFGSEQIFGTGLGGPVFLGGIIMMQLLDKAVRTKVEKRISRMRENIREFDAR